MKKVFLIILVLASVKSFSQNAYTPMNFDTSCYWVNSYQVQVGGNPICNGSVTTYVEKDTIINSTSYYKLTTYYNYQGIGGACYYFNFPSSQFYREDTVLRKLFALGIGNIEYVVLDFGLNVGDTLNLGNPFVIDSVTVDTVLNIPRRYQWYHGFFNTPYKTIEGIGNIINFPAGGGYGEWGSPFFLLGSYCKNGISYFGQGACSKPTPLSAQEIKVNNLSLSFTDNILTVQNITQSSECLVYDLLGNKIYREKIESGSYSKDLSSVLQKGFYVVSVNNAKSTSVLKIVLK